MSVARRVLLKGAGAVVVVAGAGSVWRASDQGIFSVGRGPAYEAWYRWRSDPAEGPLALVRAAVLAANPHNSQPWLFRVTDSSIDLFADPSRNLGPIDPDLREMYVGLGCALENLLLTADARGYAWQLTLLPERGNPTHAASITLEPGRPTPGALYDAIPRRHTNRGPYDPTRPVERDLLDDMARTAGEDTRLLWFVDERDRRRLGDLIVRATEAVVADDGQSLASARWLRLRWTDVQRYRDGITIDANITSPVRRAIAKMLPPLPREAGDQFWLAATRETFVATAAGFGMLIVRDAHDDAQRLRGGRAWQRLHLAATAHGLALQPLNQPTERADREQRLGIARTFGTALGELVGDRAWETLMTFRIGYPTREAALSPRRAAEAVLIQPSTELRPDFFDLGPFVSRPVGQSQ